MEFKKLSLLVAACAISGTALAKTAIFYPIDTVGVTQPNNFDFPTAPSSVSNNGQIANGGAWSPEGFNISGLEISSNGRVILSKKGITKDGVYSALSMPEDGMTFGAKAMSDNGEVIIGVNSSNSYKVWTTQDGYLSQYTELFNDVSGNGRYLITKNSLIDLSSESITPLVSNGYIYAKSVNSDGSVVGSLEHQAFLWANGALDTLGTLTANGNSSAMSLSEDGGIVVGGASSNDIDPSRSRAYQNNPESFSVQEAFIWDQSKGLRSLEEMLANEYNVDLQGWRLAGATAISADGSHIAGVGLDADGIPGRWMVRLVDECSGSSW